MKQSSFNPAELTGSRVLILSDGKPGHFNQAVAFARLLGCDYDVATVAFNFTGGKAISYLLDRCGIYWCGIFSVNFPERHYGAVVSAGSATYYANRTVAKKIKCPAIAIMFPRGYRLDFDLIIAQNHDHPPQEDHIVCLPVNLSMSQPVGIVKPDAEQRYLGLIIGGDSQHGKLSVSRLEHQIDSILSLFPEHKIWLTTSRRTSAAVETMLAGYDIDFAVYYSQQQINPIPDFLEHCEVVFITADSSSMISEAVSNGKAKVEILPITESFSPQGKFKDMVAPLLESGFAHIFDGSVGTQSGNKLNLAELLYRS